MDALSIDPNLVQVLRDGYGFIAQVMPERPKPFVVEHITGRMQRAYADPSTFRAYCDGLIDCAAAQSLLETDDVADTSKIRWLGDLGPTNL